MMQLKKYQQSALDTLKSYLQEIPRIGIKYAFIGLTERPYNSEYFADVPFVCVKIPTGGGKTLVGCCAVGDIMRFALKHKMERGIVMWFVPSEAIKTQTLKKLNDRNDWHRQILDNAFENGVRIFSNEEALRIQKGDVQHNLCIIVSSLDAFRKDKSRQKKYKVYQQNGVLLSHFENLENLDELEKNEAGTVIYSLANVIRMSNPLVVIDEGHKTQTALSVNFLNELNPSFIIEYTATPRSGSNILVDISPAELKEEDMVKIPLVLESAVKWDISIERGIDKRNELEKESKKNKNEYIRPIALIQAQPKSKTRNNITVAQIKEYLLAANISEDEIAIKTSDRNDLEGVNLFSPKCKIRYIITVNALAEGWDCAFAYVLISVANVGAKIAVEQIIGRVIRMPYAKRKKNETLNRSYIFASAKNFKEAADSIISGLEKNGYSKFDLINTPSSGGTAEDPTEAKRAIKKDFAAPLMSLENKKLTFGELIGSDFVLAEQNAEFDFVIHYDNDGRVIIDITEDSRLYRGRQQALNLTYEDKKFSKGELVLWLDKRLYFTLLARADRVKFIDKAVNYQLKQKSLGVLSVNRYLLLERLDEAINDVLEEYAKNRFERFIARKKITTKPFAAFPKTILLKQGIAQKFNKNYYEQIDQLNKEELMFAERLDILPNIKFWLRNREKQDPFYIQGWKKHRFYPDFIAVTQKGIIVALEWKGEDRLSNDDTQYKMTIGGIWEKLGEGKIRFFLVHYGNIEGILSKLGEL